MSTYKGTLTIGGGDDVRITIQDEASHVQFIEVRMSITDFALSLRGCGYQPCTFELRGLGLIGLVR